MRLTILNQFYVPDISPTAHLSASLAEHRAGQGDDVTVVTSRGGYVPASRGEARPGCDANPAVHRLWTPQFGKASKLLRLVDYACFYVTALVRLATLPRQDVIVALTTPPFIAWAGLLHKLLHPSTKLVLWNMDCYPEVVERTGIIKPGGLASRAMRLLNRAMFRRLDYLVGLDTAMNELLLGAYAQKDRPVPASVIPNWEKASFFPRDAAPPRWAPADELGLADRFVVLYLGNTGYGHQFDTVIEAAKALRDEPVTFLFVGGGSRWGEIEAMVNDAGLCNVHLHSYVPKEHTPSVMAAADCALITLRDFARGVMSPSKLHANLATGLPILYVGPVKSNVDDAIRKYGCGISVRHGQADQLSAFIREHMADRVQLAALQSAARAAFDDAYCDVQTLPQFSRVLASVGGRAPTAPAPETDDKSSAVHERV